MDYEQLIELIDERIKKNLDNMCFSRDMSATVTQVIGNKVKVRYSLDNKEGVFLNKTGEALSIGDNVFVKLINGSLSNAVVSMKFGE